MSNKNDAAIPLGSGVKTETETQEITKSTDQENSEIIDTPKEKNTKGKKAKKRKRINPAVIVVTLVLILVFVAAATVAGLFVMATTDDMPEAPDVSADMSSIIKDSAVEMISDKKITLSSDEINYLFGVLVDNSEEKLSGNGIEINDLFVVMNNDNATVYCRAVYKGVTWPIRATLEISYDDPYILVGFSSASIGKLDLPVDILMDFVSASLESGDISIHNGFIYYDTTTFNEKLSSIAIETLGLTSSDLESDDSDVDDEESSALVQWFKNIFNKISNTIKNWTAGIVSDFIDEIQFDDVKILDNNLVIEVSFESKSD